VQLTIAQEDPLVDHYVGQILWSPRERLAEIICSVGREMHDYDTLVEALSGTALR
jgi:hypothetical protein